MFALFFTHLGLGLLGCLALLPFKRLGREFFRFNVLLALGFLLVAAAFRWGREPALGWDLAACIFLLVAYVVSLRWRRNPVSPALLLSALAAGVVSVARQAMGSSQPGGAAAPLLAAHFLTSAALLGAVLLDMILGHWYLVIPGLSFGHLRRMTQILAGALLLRLAVIGWGVVTAWSAWQTTLHDSMGFLAQQGLLVVLRLVFGILGPAVLVFLVWECVRIRSNTSATGILYVATVIVLIGEIASHYFLTHGMLLL